MRRFLFTICENIEFREAAKNKEMEVYDLP